MGISSMSMSVSKVTKWVSIGRNSSRPCLCLFHPAIILNNNNNKNKNRHLSTAATPQNKNQTQTQTQTEPNHVLIKDLAEMLDIRVGRIVKAWKHPEADSLYVEQVDIGEKQHIAANDDDNDDNDDDGLEKPDSMSSLRLICSGLVNYLPLHLLQDKKVVVLANLKPRNMRGVKSFGMLLAASDSSHENVELLEPPESSLPGDRIWFGDEDQKDNLPDAASPNQIQKKKIWELVQPHLKTNSSCVAVLGEDVMRTSAGVVRCRSLKDANVS